jgi:hypothetical protein
VITVKLVILLLLLTSVLLFVHAAQEIPHCSNKRLNISFNPQPIFDESEKDILFFHRWANALHITTKTSTLKNEAAFFLSQCQQGPAEFNELERHLRSKKYIKDAAVIVHNNINNEQNIEIKTWDTWSLMPTINFGRKGGENTYSFGIKDRNLLGLGIDVEIESYTNVKRSGYKLMTTIPLYQIYPKMDNSLSLKFADNDDGKQHALQLRKSFASYHTQYAYNIAVNEESRVDEIFQNAEEQVHFTHDISFKTVQYAWLAENNSNSVFRVNLGLTQDQHLFSSLNDSNLVDLPVIPLPKDRAFIYPWLGFDYIEKNFKKLTNIHLITQIEDFNHGWQINSSLGIGDGKNLNSAWLFWQANIKKGFTLNDHGLLLINVSMLGDIYDQGNHRILSSINTEYFHKFSKNWGLYINNVNVLSNNQYRDQPITMGGNVGLRGFPLEYQHGENSIKLTAEIRYYPQINVWKIFDVAGAIFFDAGKAFGDVVEENIEKNWLASSGIGLRFYSPHTGGNNNIIHLDLAFPQSDNPDINSVEIRVQAKKSF